MPRGVFQLPASLALTKINNRTPKDSPTVIAVDAGCSSKLNSVAVVKRYGY
jgi:hypothetical protein